ncbi:MAG: tetratricopeptide repeat protein [Saprospiraceae bacterium]|nr:tetratricopeptide repeat protein [Saprospiraceae bacterium]MCF8250645.1 tetratricopeptide repeat protein [Saprospiraceae bacterium]MCF8280783.1 tetratricopeptide repeat protein [Bacteroidales bacterium]MCF8312497.1 tetratricopeptide repeat protein [Saprospiraceae bacterium]MCF8440823.1 tetratricopeptide repeat protein [Saprospiraceae bacterium]
MKSWPIHIALALLPCLAFSQVADSLAGLLKTSKPDTHRVNLLNDLAWELKFDDPKSAILHLDSAIVLSIKLNFIKGEGTAFNYRGVVADIHGESDLAIDFFQKSMRLRRMMGDKKGVASLLNNIANVKENKGDFLGALDGYQQSLKVREELRDTARVLRCYYNIANVMEKMGDYPEALDNIFQYLEGTDAEADAEGVANAWNIVGNIRTETDRYPEALEAYQKALDLHKKLGNEWQQASVLTNIANLSDTRAEDLMDDEILTDSVRVLYENAIKIFREALAIRERLEDKSGQAEVFNNLGYVLKNFGSFYDKKGDNARAFRTWAETEDYFARSLKIREELGEKAGIMEVYNGIADVRRRQKRYPEALDYSERYFAIANEINNKKYQQNALKDLARIHFKLGNFEQAYRYREQYDELRYSTFTEERLVAEQRREAVYTDKKKQQEIEKQQQELKLQDAQLRSERNFRYSLIGGAGLLTLLALTLFNRNKIIRKEKKRSEDLLLNILPAKTAEELKAHGKAKARRYDSVTVLFTDFKSFTTIAEQMPAEALVAELDECFRAFDEIVGRHGIEKIKTIGDAYFCAAGLPEPTTTHAEDMVLAALEMQVFMQKFQQKQREAGKPVFVCRLGIHTGPVVAGVVGQKKFAYDIWGDTVNMGARMESSGEPDKVNISEATFLLVKDKFKCIPRGKVLAKGKGEVEMYFVEAN